MCKPRRQYKKKEDFLRINYLLLVEIIKFRLEDVFTTADIIRLYSGGFYSNKNISVHNSLNAEFGKLLSRNKKVLGIRKLGKISIKDDLGNPTTTIKWEKTPNNYINKNLPFG